MSSAGGMSTGGSLGGGGLRGGNAGGSSGNLSTAGQGGNGGSSVASGGIGGAVTATGGAGGGVATGGGDAGPDGGTTNVDGGAAGQNNQSCPSPTTYYLDHDDDSFGGAITTQSCVPPQDIVPVVASDVTTGVWVTKGGDCGDNAKLAYPGSTNKVAVTFVRTGWSTPSYDYNCNGLEEPAITDLWVNVPTNCVYQNYQCSGAGAESVGTRSQTIPGANDLCGGVVHHCTTPTATTCGDDFNPGGKNGCN